MNSTSLTISGRVVDADGRGVPDARIGITDSPVAMPDMALLTGADGGFVLGVPVAGRYGLQVIADRHGAARIRVQVPDDPQPLAIRLQR